MLARPPHRPPLPEDVLASPPFPAEPWNELGASPTKERSSLLGMAARRSPHSGGKPHQGWHRNGTPSVGLLLRLPVSAGRSGRRCLCVYAGVCAHEQGAWPFWLSPCVALSLSLQVSLSLPPHLCPARALSLLSSGPLHRPFPLPGARCQAQPPSPKANPWGKCQVQGQISLLQGDFSQSLLRQPLLHGPSPQ